MKNLLSEWAFFLENDPEFQVSMQEVMGALKHDFAAVSHFAPRGMTGADEWMARHGNPLGSVNAAFDLSEELLGKAILWEVKGGANRWTARMRTAKTEWAEGIAHSPSVAVVAALLNHEAAKGMF